MGSVRAPFLRGDASPFHQRDIIVEEENCYQSKRLFEKALHRTRQPVNPAAQLRAIAMFQTKRSSAVSSDNPPDAVPDLKILTPRFCW